MAAKIIVIDADNPNRRILEQAALLLSGGQVVVCPTDTGYALLVNALNEEAIQKIFAIKGRSFDNPIHVAVSNLEEAEKYAEVSNATRIMAQQFLPGALTLVLPRKQTISSLLTAGRQTIGIRIPDNKIILALTHLVGCPLTTTSANASGRATPNTIEEVLDRLEDSADQVALILDQGPIVSSGVSTLVDMSTDPPQILRHGCIKDEDIVRILTSIPNLG